MSQSLLWLMYFCGHLLISGSINGAVGISMYYAQPDRPYLGIFWIYLGVVQAIVTTVMSAVRGDMKPDNANARIFKTPIVDKYLLVVLIVAVLFGIILNCLIYYGNYSVPLWSRVLTWVGLPICSGVGFILLTYAQRRIMKVPIVWRGMVAQN